MFCLIVMVYLFPIAMLFFPFLVEQTHVHEFPVSFRSFGRVGKVFSSNSSHTSDELREPVGSQKDRPFSNCFDTLKTIFLHTTRVLVFHVKLQENKCSLPRPLEKG